MKQDNKHIKSKFLEWSEGSLSKGEMIEIEQHLSGCSDCKKYFDLMIKLVSPDTKNNLKELEPDPFLPTRIKAIVDTEKKDFSSKPVMTYLRWFFITLVSSLAIFLGIMLGQGLYNSKQNYNSSSSIVSDYYQVYSQEGLSNNFESVISTGQENKK
jgi:predicted anti-sigma-YlaC factor YlaD